MTDQLPRKRNPQARGCLTAVLIAAVLCCVVPAVIVAVVAGLSAFARSNEVRLQSSETLEIVGEGTLHLEVINIVGKTEIHGADVRQIEIEIVRRAGGFSEDRARRVLENVKVEARRTEDGYLIEVEYGGERGISDVFENAQVDLLITVPEKLNLTASTQVGGLNVRNVEIVDQLQLTNQTGEIKFSGRLGPQGKHSIENQTGNVEVELAEGSAFRLEATTAVGSIELAITLQASKITRDAAGRSAAGIYGSPEADASLSISTQVGSIKIHD